MNAKLTQDELQAIKERVEKAKSGPWVYDGDVTYRKDGMLEPIIFALYGGIIYLDEEDGEFIAAARQDIPKLLAEIERLQAEVHEHSAHNGQLIATHVIPTKEENKRLRKALEFYADVKNFETFDSPAIKDSGKTAREALK